MLLVTTNEIKGKPVKEVLGLVEGVSVQSKDVIRDIGAGLKGLVGGKLGFYENMVNECKRIAKEKLIEEAKKLGANAIIGVKYTTTNTTQHGSAEIVIYGTAVKI